jgi:transcriptional regulator of NAD metabolism
VKHEGNQIDKEMDAIIGNGGTVLNVFIHHPVYGDLVAEMVIDNQSSKEEYINKCESDGFIPLMTLTDNVHYHTVEASDEKVLDRIENELDTLGFLIKE